MGATAFTTRPPRTPGRLRDRRRDENERVLPGSWGDAGAPGGDARRPLLCECGDPACSEVVWLSAGDYELSRGAAGRFAVRPGHERDGRDLVVARADRVVVVCEPPSELFLG